jgi:hypothetical protein
VKINFDTAIRGSFSVQAAVCRNSKRKIIHMASLLSPPCQPNYGEALAAKLAVSMASSHHLDLFILEGDSQVVISALHNQSITQDWRISSLIMNTVGSISASSSWKAHKMSRSANFCAHHVARWPATRSFSGSIPCSPFLFSSLPIVSGKDPPWPPSLVMVGVFPPSFFASMYVCFKVSIYIYISRNLFIFNIQQSWLLKFVIKFLTWY